MESHVNGIDRRRFLKLGALTSGLAVGGCSRAESLADDSAPVEMRYRKLGATGLEVSEISFGSYGFDNPALLSAALDQGISTICTSANYQGGRAETSIGKAIANLGSRRDELVLFTGDTFRTNATTQDVLDAIDASLRRLQTDHLEIYRITNVTSLDELRIDALYEAFDRAKKAGKVRHLGLSGHHGGMQEALKTAIDDGRYEVLFTKYDFASYPDQDPILEAAAQRGIGTMVFKTNAGNRKNEIKDLEKGGLSFKQATIKWALSHPYVASVCVGITNFDEIREYGQAVGKGLEPAEVAMLRRYTDEMFDRYCRFCGECEGQCPNGVAIADVNRYAMYFRYYGREKDSMQLYEGLGGGRGAAACVECRGYCEVGCPFNRAVREELVDAHRLLSFGRHEA
jgi:predicted aldo/keto reductase-like oxidoreductase